LIEEKRVPKKEGKRTKRKEKSQGKEQASDKD